MLKKNEILVMEVIQKLGNDWNIKDLFHIIGPTLQMEGDDLEQILTCLVREGKLKVNIIKNEINLIPD